MGNKPLPGFVRKSYHGGVYASQLQRHNICNICDMDSVARWPGGSMADFVRHGPSGVLVAGIYETFTGYRYCS